MKLSDFFDTTGKKTTSDTVKSDTIKSEILVKDVKKTKNEKDDKANKDKINNSRDKEEKINIDKIKNTDKVTNINKVKDTNVNLSDVSSVNISEKIQKSQDGMQWTQKYRPNNSKEISGMEITIKKIKDFILSYKPGKKALLIIGPPGCGKTSSVYAIANELSLEVFELNASDDRNKDSIVSNAGNAMMQGSLFGSKKLILLEEIDGISESQDRGGVTELVNLIPRSRYPVIMTANDPWDKKFSTLRSKSELITISYANYKDVSTTLQKIIKTENIDVADSVIDSIARRNGGDFRGSINDLQMLSSGKKSILIEDLDMLGVRKKTENMLGAIMRIFKTRDIEIARSAFENVDEDIDEQILWLEENIGLEYTESRDLMLAHDRLSRADVMRGRIRRKQHWDFLIYISALLTAGIALSKKEKYAKFTSYKPNSRILKIWMANQKNARKKSISQKISSKMHISLKDVYSDFDFYSILFKNKNISKTLSEYFDLDSEDLDFVSK